MREGDKPQERMWNGFVAVWVFAAALFLFSHCSAKSETFSHREFNAWMQHLCLIAPAHGFRIERSVCTDETSSDREGLWLYYFLNGKSPEQAIAENKASRFKY